MSKHKLGDKFIDEFIICQKYKQPKWIDGWKVYSVFAGIPDCGYYKNCEYGIIIYHKGKEIYRGFKPYSSVEEAVKLIQRKMLNESLGIR